MPPKEGMDANEDVQKSWSAATRPKAKAKIAQPIIFAEGIERSMVNILV